MTSAMQELVGELADKELADKTVRDPLAAPPRIGWPGTLVRGIDLVLRRCLGVREFSTDPLCIIRIAMRTASADVCLRDGTRILQGDWVGELHFWNEQLPRMPPSGPGFSWALTMQRQFLHSLNLLADRVALAQELAGIDAFRGDIMFAGALSRGAKLAQVAARHGFELVELKRSRFAALHELIDSLFILCLIRTFNPAGLRNSVWRRRRYEVWISKRTLIERYGASGRARAARFVVQPARQRG